MWTAVALALSVVVGVTLGLLGGGGSILTVPILVYVVGLEAKAAIATSLLVVGLTSAVAVVPHARAGNVAFPIGAAFGAASMLGAFAGGRLAAFLPSSVLLTAFAAMMLVTGLAMMRPRRVEVGPPSARPWPRILATGLGIGVVTGTVGAGGGFVIVPALALLCGLPILSAIATSLFVISVNSFAGFAGYVGNVAVDVRLALSLSLAAAAGSLLGVALSGRARPELLRRGFAWFVLVMGVFMVSRQVSPAVGAVALVVAVGAGLLISRRTPA